MYEQSASVVKQMIDLQRMSIEGMISNMIVFWDQTGGMLKSMLNQAAWIPEEGKKAFNTWAETNRKGCETLKDAVNNGYATLGQCFERKV